MQTLTIIKPDDWHLHLRDTDFLNLVVPYSASQMGRAIIMPNLKPPIVSVKQAQDYRQRILNGLPKNSLFNPLMTLYLTDQTSIATVKQAKQAGIVAFKLYPAGATTNSEFGVSNLFNLLPVLTEMAHQDLLLLVHGEVTDPKVDIFDREAVFIDTILIPIIEQLPELKIVFEHITTKEAVQFIEASSSNLAATVTPHHLLLNRNDILVGGIRPHYYCLPIIKRETHRQALLAAIGGAQSNKFFLGTDSAPHTRGNKECSCGCAGIFSAHIAIELYAEIFDRIGQLDKLEAFAALNGPRFYGLPPNTAQLTLIKQTQKVADSINFGTEQLIPFRAGETVAWSIKK